jgi:hypothetical protein
LVLVHRFLARTPLGSAPAFDPAHPSYLRRKEGGELRVVVLLLVGVLASTPACDRSTPPAPPLPTATSQLAPLFTEITEDRGLPPRQSYPDGHLFMPEGMGSGVAVFDYDGDGDLDIYQVVHAPPAPSFEAQLATPAPNRLWEQGPDGRFVEVGARAGIADPGYGQGVAIGDFDDDGHPDVYVTNYGQDRLYRNRGDGRFDDVTSEVGLDVDSARLWASSAAFLDYDRDGDLDIFVAHYADYDSSVTCSGEGGRPDYCGPRRFRGLPAALYRNDRGRRFVEVTVECGLEKPGRGLGVVCADFTDDGFTDIYVANDQEPNYLWVNQRGERFVDEGLARGVAMNGAGSVESGMGVATADVDANGSLDLFVTNFVGETNTLYIAEREKGFADRSASSGLSRHDLPFTGWGCGFFDLENDGDLDLAIVNGRVQRGPLVESAETKLGVFWARYAETNLLYRAVGPLRFESAVPEAGPFGATVQSTRGLALGDIDRDGDVDLVTSSVDGSLRLFRNDAPPPESRWLRLRVLIGRRDALGATLVLSGRTAAGSQVVRRQIVAAAQSYLSSSDPALLVGLAASDVVETALVRWPDGSTESFSLGPDAERREIVLRKGEGREPPRGISQESEK